jgi:exodeoxyribonuclease VII, large subunit
MIKALSVKQFNEYFKTNIKHDPILSRVNIKGNLANIRYNQNHLYFSLKEDSDVIDCVIYYYEDKDINFSFDEGMDVIIKGNLYLNNYSSRIVIVTNNIEKVGLSEEYAKFIKLKEDFKKRGYFDLKNKKLIPTFPKNVGLITSKDGAAIVDFLSVINQKPNDISVKLAAVKVQGSQSSELIVNAIKKLDDLNLDVIVITRGGGSSEDLSAFNNKEIIEAVYLANTPVISAIGHKIDTTLLDLVADLSLQTPTEAGYYIIANYSNIEKQSEKILNSMRDTIKNQINIDELRLTSLKKNIKAFNPNIKVDDKLRDIDNLKKNFDKILLSNYKDIEIKLDFFEKRLKLSKSLIETKKKSIIIKDTSGNSIFSKYSLKNGDKVEIEFSDGRIKAIISDG